MGSRHQDDVRAKIQASQLINILTNHALGISEEISASRMKAIEILLKKSLPDLQAVELSSNPDAPPTFNVGLPWLTQAIQKRN